MKSQNKRYFIINFFHVKIEINEGWHKLPPLGSRFFVGRGFGTFSVRFKMRFTSLKASKPAQRSAVLLDFWGTICCFSLKSYLLIAVSRSFIRCFQVKGSVCMCVSVCVCVSVSMCVCVCVGGCDL